MELPQAGGEADAHQHILAHEARDGQPTAAPADEAELPFHAGGAAADEPAAGLPPPSHEADAVLPPQDQPALAEVPRPSPHVVLPAAGGDGAGDAHHLAASAPQVRHLRRGATRGVRRSGRTGIHARIGAWQPDAGWALFRTCCPALTRSRRPLALPTGAGPQPCR